MIRLAARRLWTRRLQALAPLVALLAATLGFQAVLVSARSTQSHVQGVIAANWNPPYDLLVRPPSLVTGLKPGDHLIRPNYLDSAQGGITLDQVAMVRAQAGVTVAAPVGVVGIDVLNGTDYTIDASKLPTTGDLNIYRLHTTFTFDGGTSSVVGTTPRLQYIIVQGKNPPYVLSPAAEGYDDNINVGGQEVICVVWCFTSPNRLTLTGPSTFPFRPPFNGHVMGYDAELTTPIVTVDPTAEAALFGVDHCLLSGRDLTPSDAVIPTTNPNEVTGAATIPILANGNPGYDDKIHVSIEAAASVAPVLAALPGAKPPSGSRFPLLGGGGVLESLTYHAVGDISTDLNQTWNGTNGVGFLDDSTFTRGASYSIDTLGPVMYQGKVPYLVAQTVPIGTGYSTYTGWNVEAPPETDAATQFHSLTINPAPGIPWHNFTAVGRYDPGCVTKKFPLTRSAFDIYANPSTRTPEGRLLGPNPAITNYVTPMPGIMTNLAGGAYFSDPKRFAQGHGSAFLSVIRVKVSGADVPGPTSQKRLEQVAADIHKRTGLAVDIIKGSSTQQMLIGLPAGEFGRPLTTVTENWLTENVAITFFNAINSTTVVMSVVVTAVAILLTMQTTYATVRRRRGELVLLRAVGWSSWRLALLMELEVVGLGVLVAMIALLVAGFIILVNHPSGPVVSGILLAAPAAIALTAFAGLGPAFTASRTRPLAALRGPGRLRKRRRGLIRGPFTLGIREALTTWRWQTLIGAIATAVGAMFLGAVLAIIHGFHTSLDSTALAQQLANEVGPFDVLLGVLAVLLGATTAVSVVLVATRERLPHFATLRALGWSRAKVARVVAGQALAVGLLGGVLGVIALSVVANRVKTGIALTLSSQLSPLVLGAATGIAAAIGAVRLVYRRVIVTVLRVG